MTPVVTLVIRMPEERNLDRQIDLCRIGARKDRATVVIERTLKSGRRIPVLEITPAGDVREVAAPAFPAGATDIRARLTALHTDENFVPNQKALEGYSRFSSLVLASDRELAAARAAKHAANQARRDRQAKRPQGQVVYANAPKVGA